MNGIRKSENGEYHDNHYAEMKRQPIDVMNECFDEDEMYGYLMGQIIKYHMRAGHKAGETYGKDMEKRNRYIAWYYQVFEMQQKIDPRQISIEIPDDWLNGFLDTLYKICKE